MRDWLEEDRAARYRLRAEEARTKAHAASDEDVRQSLLKDADLWERMAQFEEGMDAQ